MNEGFDGTCIVFTKLYCNNLNVLHRYLCNVAFRCCCNRVREALVFLFYDLFLWWVPRRVAQGFVYFKDPLSCQNFEKFVAVRQIFNAKNGSHFVVVAGMTQKTPHTASSPHPFDRCVSLKEVTLPCRTLKRTNPHQRIPPPQRNRLLKTMRERKKWWKNRKHTMKKRL